MTIHFDLSSIRLRCDLLQSMKIELFSVFSGWLLPVILPILHVTTLWFFWSKYHFRVDRSSCTCECWDLVFKGPYESGVGTYKNFYFNATTNTLKIWTIVVSGVIVFYECVKHLTQLLLRGKLRFSMLVLCLASIFPHYYSWWAYINYLNDSFYVQWNHQLFFTVTEAMSTCVVMYLANVHHEMTQFKLLFVMAISVTHLIAGGLDQFYENIILLEGSPHQVIRDLGFIVPDLLYIFVSLIELDDLRRSDLFFKRWYKDKHLLLLLAIMTLFVVSGCYIVSQL